MRKTTAFGSLAGGVVLLMGCGGGLEWNQVSPTRSELYVYTSTARFLIENYDPSDHTGKPAAFCLVVGRRESVARRQRARESRRWDPRTELLNALNDLNTPVVPISHCSQNSNLEEIHGPTGRRAVVLGISQPVWGREDFASVRVSTYENSTYYGSWRCNVRRLLDEWEVLDCL